MAGRGFCFKVAGYTEKLVADCINQSSIRDTPNYNKRTTVKLGVDAEDQDRGGPSNDFPEQFDLYYDHELNNEQRIYIDVLIK